MPANHFDDNQVLWAADLNTVSDAVNGTAPVSGATITKDAGDWDTNVSAGTVMIKEQEITVTAANVTHSDASGLQANESRIDLVTVNESDSKFVIEGTNATNPTSPDLPDGNVTVGLWHIEQGDTTLADADRFDTPSLRRPVAKRKIETQTPSGASSADFTSSFGNHKAHVFVLHNVIPAADDVELFLRTSSDGGSTWDSGASDYEWSADIVRGDGTSAVVSTENDAKIIAAESGSTAGVGSAAGEDGVSGTVKVYGTGLAKRTMVTGEVTLMNRDGNQVGFDLNARRDAAEDVTGVRFLFNTTNIESGTIEHYGWG